MYNAEVENYILQFLLIEDRNKPTTALIHQISIPSLASVPMSPNNPLENVDIVKNQAKENGGFCVGEEGEGEGVESGVTPVKNRVPQSADSSLQVSPKFQHSNKIREHMVKRAK